MPFVVPFSIIVVLYYTMYYYKSKKRGKDSSQTYTEDYYAANREEAWSSARVIVPLVLELVQPRSVVDVGCGLGAWLAVFKEHGVDDTWGLDGKYVDKNRLEIPEERFILADLGRPFHLDRTFDLVVSLEVAEHLPSESAEIFVDTLTHLGPLVLFSAAIPYQAEKKHGHVNEQWPEYWAELFADRGYVAIDCLRRKLWYDQNAKEHYAQNTLMFAKREHLDNQPLLYEEFKLRGDSPLSLVHPRTYMRVIEERKISTRFVRRVKTLVPPRAKRFVRAALSLTRN
jgi:SAM-dependent methyltransferase